jgi:hypothetical protein
MRVQVQLQKQVQRQIQGSVRLRCSRSAVSNFAQDDVRFGRVRERTGNSDSKCNSNSNRKCNGNSKCNGKGNNKCNGNGKCNGNSNRLCAMTSGR